MTAFVYALATMDTKGQELAFVAERLRRCGVAVRTVDVGTLAPPSVPPDVSRDVVEAAIPDQNLRSATDVVDRGAAIDRMADGLRAYLGREAAAGRVLGVIGIGGSGGTALISPALRALPIGLPKVLVSTVASGNVAPYVDCSDIMMLFSVVDVAGLNSVSTCVLGNAAAAMAGMVTQQTRDGDACEKPRPAIGMTMFGVTTPCVTRVRETLEAEGNDALVFHATGTGGRAMEQLVASGFLAGVLDITTTEVADEIVGGVFAAGPERFDRVLSRQIPYVLSLGALDMVNFGAIETLPQQFQKRRLHRHNAQVTLMRTAAEECDTIGRWIAEKLNRSVAPLRLLIPEGGLSLLDVPGQPFYDPEADAALFDSLETHLNQTPNRQIVRSPWDINAPAFADTLLEHFREVSGQSSNA